MCVNSKKDDTACREVFDKIQELVREGVFEIWHPGEWDGNIYIPFMMNDALECYIILKNAVLVGQQLADRKSVTTVEIHSEEERFALVARQGEENTFTVFFTDAVLEKKYYRFDTICHFWETGQEQWSQLVYMIGTMFDKYAFLGEESCNEEEMSLMDLIEFAPFRYHAPAKQLFEELYDTTRKGAGKMLVLSLKAGDYWYGIMVFIYWIFMTERMARLLSKMLTKPARYKLYCYIYHRVQKAASAYPERTYEKDIIHMRNNLDRQLKQKGFEGTYPDYVKGNQYIRVVEEHPFTIMDWENVTLKQTLMISECSGKKKGINLGFFRGKNLKAYYCDAKDYFYD